MVWSDGERHLNERLATMAQRITPGQTCADIGTDHGYLPLFLYEQGISPFVILTDLSEDSLAKAKAAAGAAQYGSDLSFRVGDGLEVIEAGEVDCVVIAGMGGHLIREILSKDIEKTNSFKRFILQPRSASGPLRKWLLEAGFSFLNEDVVREGDFLPEIMTLSPRGISGTDLAEGIRNSLVGTDDDNDYPEEDSIHFSVPMWMLEASGPVIEFIERRISIEEDKLAGMKKAAYPDATAIEKVEYNLDYLRQLAELKKHKEEWDAEEDS